MSKLMPQATLRGCSSCSHVWTTAYFGVTACPNPKCGVRLLDCSAGAPHVCAQGHGHPHGGDCPTCREDDCTKRKPAKGSHA